MNLDDLMEVWRAQDASPLVDKTRLHKALRQEQAELQKDRIWTRWLIFIMTALILAGAGVVVVIMFFPRSDDVRIVWDYAIPLVGASAALVMGRIIYVAHRARPVREQGFGESLRDQLALRIAQLDHQVARGAYLTVAGGTAAGICGAAFFFAGWRANDHAYSEGLLLKGLIVLVFCLVVTAWEYGSGRRRTLPRKRQLETLLKELDRK